MSGLPSHEGDPPTRASGLPTRVGDLPARAIAVAAVALVLVVAGCILAAAPRAHVRERTALTPSRLLAVAGAHGFHLRARSRAFVQYMDSDGDVVLITWYSSAGRARRSYARDRHLADAPAQLTVRGCDAYSCVAAAPDCNLGVEIEHRGEPDPMTVVQTQAASALAGRRDAIARELKHLCGAGTISLDALAAHVFSAPDSVYHSSLDQGIGPPEMSADLANRQGASTATARVTLLRDAAAASAHAHASGTSGDLSGGGDESARYFAHLSSGPLYADVGPVQICNARLSLSLSPNGLRPAQYAPSAPYGTGYGAGPSSTTPSLNAGRSRAATRAAGNAAARRALRAHHGLVRALAVACGSH